MVIRNSVAESAAKFDTNIALEMVPYQEMQVSCNNFLTRRDRRITLFLNPRGRLVHRNWLGISGIVTQTPAPPGKERAGI